MPPQSDSTPWRDTAEAQELAQKLVESWACLDKFPLQKPAQARLAKTILTYCQTAEHARAVAAAFTEYCPHPKAIQQAAARLGPQDEPVMDRLRREYAAEVRRALAADDAEALQYYAAQHPEIVERERRKLAGAA